MMAAIHNADVVVIGAGVTGCSIAYRLARAGVDVLVVERGDVTHGTSGACDGYVVMQSKHPGVHLDLALQSIALFEHLSEELDYDVHYRRCGCLIMITGPDQWKVMDEHVRKQREAGLPLELLDREAVMRHEPILTGEFDGASYCALDGQADPLRLGQGFAAGAIRSGARFMLHTEVNSISLAGGRVRGVRTDKGDITCDTVVVAGGIWTPALVEPIGVIAPVEPLRGMILVTEAMPKIFNHVILDARYIAVKFGIPESGDPGAPVNRYKVSLSIEQSYSGNLLIGNTRQYTGFDDSTEVDGMNAMKQYVLRVAPSMGDLNIIRTFAGLRPRTPDGLPMLGPVKGIDGLVMAAGHEGDGITLAPVTGKIISEYICSGRVPPIMEAFLPDRFQPGTGNSRRDAALD